MPVPKVGYKPTLVKAPNTSGGPRYPSFKNRVKGSAMNTAFPGASKPIAFKLPKLTGAYR